MKNWLRLPTLIYFFSSILVFISCVEAGTLFDVLAGFYRAVIVEIGGEVAMSADLRFGIAEAEKTENDLKAMFLSWCASVGWSSGGVESTFVGDADTVCVVTFHVCTDMGDVAHVVYRSVTGDVVVIAAFGEAAAFVHGVEGFGS